MPALLILLLLVVVPALGAIAYRVGLDQGRARSKHLEGNDGLLDDLIMLSAQHAELGDPFAVIVADEIRGHRNRNRRSLP